MTCGLDLTDEELLSILQHFPDDVSHTDNPGISSDYSKCEIGERGTAQTVSEDVQ
jgi:hypothetical protein